MGSPSSASLESSTSPFSFFSVYSRTTRALAWMVFTTNRLVRDHRAEVLELCAHVRTCDLRDSRFAAFAIHAAGAGISPEGALRSPSHVGASTGLAAAAGHAAGTTATAIHIRDHHAL